MRYLSLATAIGLCTAPLHAQSVPATSPAPLPNRAEPTIGPAPDWIVPVSIPAANAALRDRPLQTLLTNSQIRFEPNAHSAYAEMAFLIQNPQGMQGLGTIILPWQPDHSDLVIHKVHIVRNGAVIDLLAGGRRFTVARRESNLDSAMLDGILTAMMQADGLAIGDTLNVAFTIRRRGGALPLRAENFFALAHGLPIRRLHTRLLWPADMPVRWRATGALERQVRERRTRLGKELLLDLADAEGPQPPAMAPPRFLFSSTLQVSGFRDWAEIGSQLAPHYARAAALAVDSPLRARIAEIAASTPDSRARAMAALRLVQDEIRYFAVTIGDGNYLPASADETWSRRYGDCKGKTAVLLAMLHSLGIEAEAVLVHSALGDALPGWLPQMGLFDHVIVRARIGGTSYWLDGTRTGHRQIEELASSRLGWGLPLRDSGSELERLPFTPAAAPITETHIEYDGSNGLLGEIPVSGTIVWRGEVAASMRAMLAQAGETEFQRMAREWVPGGDNGGMTVSHSADDREGTFTLRFAGSQRMDWTGGSQARQVTFRFNNDTVTWTPNFARTGTADADAPFQVFAPVDSRFVETVLLPDGGRGFTLTGQAIDRTVGGVHFSRTVSLENGRAISRSSVRQVATEILPAEALASAAALTEIAQSRASVQGRPGTLAPADRAVLAGREPVSASDFVERGYGFLQRSALDEAMADFERAATLRPEWSRPLSNQATVMLRHGKLDEAEALIARAAALDANDFVVSQARGVAQLLRNRPVQAVAALTRSLELEPGNTYTLARRAEAYQQLGEFDDALADFAAILEREPSHAGALHAIARIHVWRNDSERAAAAIEAFAAADGNDPARLAARGEMLQAIGRNEAAAEAFARALASVETSRTSNNLPAEASGEMRHQIFTASRDMPAAVREVSEAIRRRPDNARLLNERCWSRATGNIELELALADCDRALALAPNNAAYLDSRALVKLRLGRFEEAIADATAALAAAPRLAPALYVRGVAHMRRGDRASAERDLALARRLAFDIDLDYRRYGVTP